MGEYEVITLVLRTFAVLLVAAGLFYTGYQIKMTRQIHKDNHEWNRRKAAQDVLMNVDLTTASKELNKALEFLDVKESIPLEKILTAIKEDRHLQNLIHKLLNVYEGYARGINQGIFDEEVIKTARKGTMIRVLESFSSYIKYRREGWADKAWIQAETLIRKWQNEDFKNTPKRKHTGAA